MLASLTIRLYEEVKVWTDQIPKPHGSIHIMETPLMESSLDVQDKFVPVADTVLDPGCLVLHFQISPKQTSLSQRKISLVYNL